LRSAFFALALFAAPFTGIRFPAQHEPPRVAWTTPNPDYPLKVHVLSSARTEHQHGGIVDTRSYGSGNLLGDTKVGFDYNSNCEGGFMHNAEGEESYQGKWKKQDRKIEILVVQTGSNHPEKCEIDVTLKAAPYGKDNPPPRLVTAR
jgi:hypothetical protein